ncbi:Ubiquitin-like modifier-activating enzyme ATG7 [Melipona quadrifasciata]|uniref:Ubiquitin-like modifier-activating enzyme ATG7 n=1 Tax=Melipona quadrifasciata TaxID=166423 RepID=A0A0M9A4B2_9HYME|nr:Ubiquitin-like modifier-activating enzyme ATG7 [Melipona quadrifasciata]
MSKFVKFSKLRSATDSTFWAKFVELKIDKFKLDEKSISIWGSYGLQSLNEDNSNPLTLDFTSFNEDVESVDNSLSVLCCGRMINTNTFEAFRQINPEKFIDSMGKDVINSIRDGTALQSPWKLSLFLVLAYSDLKKYKFYYWVAHPTPLRLPEMSRHYENYKNERDSLFLSNLVGWESNLNDKLGPTIVNLSDTMDPAKLSDRAVNLNLKLMKWRLVPNLDLEKIYNLKCLLLGAGTLGCAVARVLLGWGVNNITFVDNSNVSHSNTVRQSLYSHQDAVKHKHKAYAAKDAVLNIRPSINAEGVVLHIPMPGHVVGESMLESTKKSLEKLEELVENSDVVFLLLDSREARWLPTVLCAAKNKIAINAALGFDSYTVQRHGTRNFTNPISPDLEVRNPRGVDLGCYFCNDVTQPGNSQTDRTVDQQCTVSRPGLSQIAAGLAVELLITLLQHPLGIEAEALVRKDNISPSDTDLVGLLGCVPHTIRGSLWNYDTHLTITHRFTSCTACSVPIVAEYKNRGLSFVLDACNMPNYLEKLSGLEQILKRPDLDELCYALDNTSDDDEDDKKI